MRREMVDHLEQLTRTQAMSKEWFKYRARWITASRYKQVLSHRPSLSLLKIIFFHFKEMWIATVASYRICYPDTCRFSSKATSSNVCNKPQVLRLRCLVRNRIAHWTLSFSSCILPVMSGNSARSMEYWSVEEVMVPRCRVGRLLEQSGTEWYVAASAIYLWGWLVESGLEENLHLARGVWHLQWEFSVCMC